LKKIAEEEVFVVKYATSFEEIVMKFEIVVRKPTDDEIKKMKTNPTWGCKVSEFDWFYDDEEVALIIDGEVTVEYNGKSISFGGGDLVVFPRGLSCRWIVKKPVRKHYEFR